MECTVTGVSCHAGGVAAVSSFDPSYLVANLTSEDASGRRYAVLSEWAKIKRLAMQKRKKEFLAEQAA